MAKAAVRANFQIDFRSTIDIGLVATGMMTVATATLVRITYDAANYDIFTGDFVYDSVTGDLTGGTITGIRGYRGGSVAFTVSDFSMPVTDFLLYVQAGDTQGALADLFDGHDSISGSSFSDYLIGYDGNDTLNGAAGVDTMEGGAGDDLYIANSFYDTFYELDGGGIDTVKSSSDALLDANVENLILTGSTAVYGLGNEIANNILGTAGKNILAGFEGDDTISAGAGNDWLFGFEGNNSLSGGAGKDLYIYDPAIGGTDWVNTGDNGIDSVYLSGPLYDWDFDRVGDDLYIFGYTSGSDSYDEARTIRIANHFAGGAIAYFEGDFGVDTNLFYGGNPNLTRVYTPSGLTGKNQGKNAELIVGGDANDSINGNGGQTDWLFGKGGDDTITGKSAAAGAAGLYGGDGNDSLVGGAGNDNLNGGTGNDTMNGAGDNPAGPLFFLGDRADFRSSADGITVDLNKQGVAQFISADQGTDTLIEIENVRGSQFNDVIAGDDDRNWLYGGLADDSLAGNGAADTLEGSLGNDTLAGGEDDDELYGSDGDDLIQGGGGFDYIEGWKGNDTLDGGGVEGEDLITYFGVDAGVIVNLSDVEQSGVAAGTAKDGLGTIDTLIDVVGVQGSDNADMMFGNDGYNYFEGNAGNDTLEGGGGSDGLDFFNAAEGVNVNLNNQGVSQVFANSLGSDLVSGFEEIYGSFFNDTLIGDGNANFLLGRAGKDSIAGNGGNDTLYGGLGNDTLLGGDGNDTIDFHRASSGVAVNIGKENAAQAIGKSEGADLLAGFEDIVGSDFGDKLIGNAAANKLAGLAGNDLLAGNAGNDTLDGAEGADAMAGGADDDLYLVDNVKDKVTEAANAGHDLVQSTATHTLSANVDDLELLGDADADINGTGNAITNNLKGTDGDNILDGKGAADTMTGGLGNDVYVQDVAGDIAEEAADEGSDELRTNQALSFVVANIEHYTFTGMVAVNFTGDDVANSITGTVKNDTLTGGLGDDTLNGGVGADNLSGGKGNDTYVVNNAGDKPDETGGSGIDKVISSITFVLADDFENLTLDGVAAINGTGNAVANEITGNAGANVMKGLGGADTLRGAGGNDTYWVGTGDVVLEDKSGGTDLVQSEVDFKLGANIENLTLNDGALSGTGNELNNILIGNGNDNKLDGGGGKDKMAGGLGDDFYVVDMVGDVVTEAANAGKDTVTVNGIIPLYVLGANLENLVLLDGFGDLKGTGNALKNSLTGNDGNNSLAGGGDEDTLTGNLGNDTLDGGAGADSLLGGKGDDTYVVDNLGDKLDETGGNGIDNVNSSITFLLADGFENLALIGGGAINGTGNTLANKITGNGAVNTLTGNEGNDTLQGGGGNDIVIGGAGNDSIDVAIGNDTVRYTSKLDGLDTIDHFDGNAAGGQDVLNLDALFDDLGVLAVDRAGRVEIVDNGSSVNISVDADGNAGNGFELAVAVLNTADAISIGQDVVVGT